MLRFLRNIALLLLIMSALYPLLLWQAEKRHVHANVAYTRGNYSHLLRRGQDVRHYDSIDVLFVGSSRCYRTFDTRYYARHGLTTFNLGSSNQTPLQTLALLQEYLDSLHPRYVVMEVNPDVLCDEGVEGGIDITCNLPVSTPLAAMMLQNGNAYSLNTLALALVKHWQRQDFAVSDSLIPVDAEKTQFFAYVPGGFVESTPHHWQPTAQPPATVVILSQQLKAAKQCHALCSRHGIPLLMVEAPVSNAKYTSYRKHEVFSQAMKEITPAFVDCNALPAFADMRDSTHFYDADHMNRDGVAFFNHHFLNNVLLEWMQRVPCRHAGTPASA